MSGKNASEHNNDDDEVSANDVSVQSPHPSRYDVSTPMRPSILTPSTPKSEFHHFAESILSPLGLFTAFTPGDSRQPHVPSSKDWSPMATFSTLSGTGDFFSDFLDSPIRDNLRTGNGLDTPIGSSEAALQQNRNALHDRVSGHSSSGVAGFPELKTKKNTQGKGSNNSNDMPPTHKKGRKSSAEADELSVVAEDATHKKKRTKLQQQLQYQQQPTQQETHKRNDLALHSTPPSSTSAASLVTTSGGLLSASSTLTHNSAAIGSPQSYMLDASAVGPPSLSPSLARSNVTCNCKKSKCLKLYCDCFRAQQYCFGCHCNSCFNVKAHEGERRAAVVQITDRNPDAFKPRIAKDHAGQTQQHQSGCHCKKSACLKKYCECFQAAVPCQDRCRCIDCKNTVAILSGSPSSGALSRTPNSASPVASWSPTPTKEYFKQKNISLDKDAENAAIEFVSALLRGQIPSKMSPSPASSSLSTSTSTMHHNST